ncbi:DUF2529 family protein [Salinibacillus xinjiangensis]|uniref:DUF2529 family protein n=1 Tax=Salinibacillus xinjiangensis TaxID=1229268 RepID=A0A6G1X5P8_9BACI|nr:DUF2529 family protein [Salinibacillus xinjiangensis]MRG86226.1 DUF2529 family protein [Salinibacillus xinjiangensis]
MLQLFTTQLINKLNQIQNEEELAFEEAARSLANAVIGDGHIYWYATGEMQALLAEIEHGAEPFPSSKLYDGQVDLSSTDRVVVAARFADDQQAVEFIEKVQHQGVEVIALSAVKSEQNPLPQFANYHIDTKLVEALVPLDEEKIAFPAVMTMLYTYYGLYVTTKEMIADFEGELPGGMM